ncbi:glycosyltransferase [Desulfospira joergensenii]|uniref:glycosyltransferase n=1 Tax=Desulfospira joergensenii TaxID=53329 RepID=UPI0003FF53FD|nr:glycosyltransferase [Desulfospira joergensenii]
MISLTVAVCTYNRAENLKPLIKALRSQDSSINYDILIINNNSTDDTEKRLIELQTQPGVSLRFVKEVHQGIVEARNRALQESLDSEYLIFMDDDELPREGFIEAAIRCFEENNAECVGGKVKNDFSVIKRPKWLNEELLGFLAEVDYGDKPFWIKDKSTPLWTANIGYKTELFRDGLKFDKRYNRKGKGIGGGSDMIMFSELLDRGTKIRYCPGMVVNHYPEPWRLKRRYFFKLHFIAGRKQGQFQPVNFESTFLGVPFFMVINMMKHLYKTIKSLFFRDLNTVRQAMNVFHSIGMIWGRYLRWKTADEVNQKTG